MRQFLAPLVLTALLHNAALAQSGAKPKACALLTADVVKAVSVAKKKSGTVAAPSELPLGAQGSACVWGEVTFQVDPFTPAQVERLPTTTSGEWESVKGVGDAAWFHHVRDMIGELYVRVGKRTFAVLIDIPQGTTAAAFKPNFITVANAVVPKLK